MFSDIHIPVVDHHHHHISVISPKLIRDPGGTGTCPDIFRVSPFPFGQTDVPRFRGSGIIIELIEVRDKEQEETQGRRT
jgi:hypothetical protein